VSPVAGRTVEVVGPGPDALASGLGVTTSPSITFPADLVFHSVSAGSTHTCATTTSGQALCWGYNGMGQLGLGIGGLDSAVPRRARPSPVVGLPGEIAAVGSGGFHQCAVTADGGLFCWGNNWYGQLGDGTSGYEGTSPNFRPSPDPVVGLGSGVVALSAGYLHTCALTTNGGVKCWGLHLHEEDNEAQATPLDVPGLDGGVVAIAAGGLHTCAVLHAGVKCWGYNEYGQLGVDPFDRDMSEMPVTVPGLGGGIKAIAGGAYHTCAVFADGTVKCWGENGYGQLGNGDLTYQDRSTPVDVVGLTEPATAVAASGGHTCVILASHRVECWGSNLAGQLGTGGVGGYDRDSRHPLPVEVVGIPARVVAITASVVAGHEEFAPGFGELPLRAAAILSRPLGDYYEGHTCAVLDDGAIYCWGGNSDGQLGDGGTAPNGMPRPLAAFEFGFYLPICQPLDWR